LAEVGRVRAKVAVEVAAKAKALWFLVNCDQLSRSRMVRLQGYRTLLVVDK
jgi:hypothetical protein